MTSFLLWALSWFNTLEKAYEAARDWVTYVYTGAEQIFGPQTYIFFQGITSPYREVMVNPAASGSAPPEWKYDAKNHTFLEYGAATEVQQKSHRLPILSLEIVQKDKVIYDLTDFLDTVRVYASGEKAPSTQHIIGAWGLSSGIILNRTRGYEARMITNQAATFGVPIRSTEGLHYLVQRQDEQEEGEIVG
jgi:hypothetical protein